MARIARSLRERAGLAWRLFELLVDGSIRGCIHGRFGLRRERPEVSTSSMTAIITAAISMAQSMAVIAKCYRGVQSASNTGQLVAGQIVAGNFAPPFPGLGLKSFQR